jgi:hypothetical protein
VVNINRFKFNVEGGEIGCIEADDVSTDFVDLALFGWRFGYLLAGAHFAGLLAELEFAI